MCAPAKVGYLSGDSAGRKKLEFLANQAWLAIPGTTDGKAQAFPQPRPLERWMAFVYGQISNAPSSYLSAEEELWVEYTTRNGQLGERRFAPQAIEKGEIISRGYPGATRLTNKVGQWIYTALATDPSTASAVAVDLQLANADPNGSYLISMEELVAYQKSPVYQSANFLVDSYVLGEGRHFPIYRNWCKPVAGVCPTICPCADPPISEADRRALSEFLPQIVKRFRGLHLIKKDETIHWVGRQASLGTLCRCDQTGTLIPKSVVLRGKDKGPIVRGSEKTILTTRQYKIIEALLVAGENGLTKDQLDEKSGRSEARKDLAELRKSDADWAAVIHMPGKAGRGGYRIR